MNRLINSRLTHEKSHGTVLINCHAITDKRKQSYIQTYVTPISRNYKQAVWNMSHLTMWVKFTIEQATKVQRGSIGTALLFL